MRYCRASTSRYALSIADEYKDDNKFLVVQGYWGYILHELVDRIQKASIMSQTIVQGESLMLCMYDHMLAYNTIIKKILTTNITTHESTLIRV